MCLLLEPHAHREGRVGRTSLYQLAGLCQGDKWRSAPLPYLAQFPANLVALVSWFVRFSVWFALHSPPPRHGLLCPRVTARSVPPPRLVGSVSSPFDPQVVRVPHGRLVSPPTSCFGLGRPHTRSTSKTTGLTSSPRSGSGALLWFWGFGPIHCMRFSCLRPDLLGHEIGRSPVHHWFAGLARSASLGASSDCRGSGGLTCRPPEFHSPQSVSSRPVPRPQPLPFGLVGARDGAQRPSLLTFLPTRTGRELYP